MNAATKLLRRLLDRGAYLARFERETLLTILPILEQAHESILGKIAKTKGILTAEWLTEAASDITEIYRAATAKALGSVRGDLASLAASEAEWLAAAANGLEIGVSFTTPSPNALAAAVALPTSVAGSTLEQLFQALGETSRAAVYDAINSGMTEGETVDQLTARLRGEVVKRASWRKVDGRRRYVPGVYSGGAMEGVTTRQAEQLARTATMHVSNRARDLFYAENEDVIKGYQHVATLDLDTCVVCGALDGREYALKAPKPDLPIHPSCRCLYAPVLKSFRELGIDIDEAPAGTRASMDGQVPEFETFETRLVRMSEKRQDILLGRGRADLYRNGMPLTDMVDGTKKLTLEQIAARRKARAA